MTRPAAEVALVDFGMGNLRSVARAFERAGAKPCVTTRPEDVLGADRVVLPGVGAMADCMEKLTRLELVEPLRERIARGRPYLGLCLGLHALFERGEEGDATGLGVIPGQVARFEARPGRVIPHMGWNEVEPTRAHPVVARDFFYFVHSYRPVDVPEAAVVARTDYGERFCSAVATGPVVAVQFHPEKSQHAGLELIERFCAWTP